MDNRQENRRGSLRIDTYLPMWIQKVELADTDRVKSLIADYAVQRHVIDYCEDDSLPEDTELRLLFAKVDRLQKMVRHYLGQEKNLKKHPYVSVALTLSATGCSLKGSPGDWVFREGDMVEVHLLLPTHPLDVFILGRIGENGAIAFDMISPDQEDWIIEYLIHRQQQDIRLNINRSHSHP